MQTTKHANKLFSADMLRGYMLAVFMALFSALKITHLFEKAKLFFAWCFFFFREQIS